MYGILLFQIFYMNRHFRITKARTSDSVNNIISPTVGIWFIGNKSLCLRIQMTL